VAFLSMFDTPHSLHPQVAEDLAREDIGVVITHPRAFPFDWNSRRIMPGPPLSNHTLASYLASHGVVRVAFPLVRSSLLCRC
jgi:hypothetical protein